MEELFFCFKLLHFFGWSSVLNLSFFHFVLDLLEVLKDLLFPALFFLKLSFSSFFNLSFFVNAFFLLFLLSDFFDLFFVLFDGFSKFSIFSFLLFDLLRTFLSRFGKRIGLDFCFEDWVFFDRLNGAIEIRQLPFKLLFLLCCLYEFMFPHFLFIPIFRFSHRTVSIGIDYCISVDNLLGNRIVELLDSGLGEVLGFGWSLVEKVL